MSELIETLETVFGNWRERLAGGKAVPQRIRYTRKSSEDASRQTASHERQDENLNSTFGPIDPRWTWRDDFTGTTFKRPNFQDLIEFCKAHPQPKARRGIVEMDAPSRFGRILDEDGEPDLSAYMIQYLSLVQLGWECRFVSVRLTGEPMVDYIIIAIHATEASKYSVNISKSVSSGKRLHAKHGWWVHAVPPFGAKRFDTYASKELMEGDASVAKGGGVILIPNPQLIDIWDEAAKWRVSGVSWNAIAERIYERGLRGLRGGAFNHSYVKKILTNRALIGRIEYTDVLPDGRRERKEAEAKWQPLVDKDLFAAVEETVRNRGQNSRTRRRKKQEAFPLAPLCNHCGATYIGNRYGESQGRLRSYHHPTPKVRFDPQGHAAFKAAGCLEYHVEADELENGIKDLIVRQRTSPEYEQGVKELVLERDEGRKQAEDQVESAREQLDKEKRGLSKVANLLDELSEEDAREAESDHEIENEINRKLKGKIQQAKQRVREAHRQLKTAEEFAGSIDDAWNRICSAIHETRNIAAAWKRMEVGDRRVLFSHWIEEVHIVVERIPEKKRANNKTAVIWLKRLPLPLFLPVGRQLPSAAVISSETEASSSRASRSSSAVTAEPEGIRPSAQAACARTRGAGSDSAEVSTGTASADPQLPSATQTLRANPARPARRIGEPLENESQAAVSSAISSNSMSEGESVPGCQTSDTRGSTREGSSPGARAAYAASDEGSENLRVKGHTSWQMSHP